MARSEAQGPGAHAAAARLRKSAQAALLALAAMVLWIWVHEAAATARALTTWPVIPARIDALTDDPPQMTVEVESAVADRYPSWTRTDAVGARDGHVRVILHRPASLWADPIDGVQVAVDPDRPARARVLDPLALGMPLVAGLLMLALIAAAWVGLARLPWGRDEVWMQGRWQVLAGPGPAPGGRASPDDSLREPDEHLRGTRFWAVTMGLLTALVLTGAWVEGVPWPWAELWLYRVSPLMPLLALGLFALDGLLAHTWVSVRTRRIVFDAAGWADRSWFQTRRVPWSAVARFERINTRQAAQAAWDRDFRRSGNRTGGRSRPSDSWSWVAKGLDGGELLRLPEEMTQQPAFARLVRRMPAPPGGMSGTPGTRDAERGGFERDLDGVDRAIDRARRELTQGHAGPPGTFRPGVSLAALLLTLSPFLLASTWSTGQTLWFLTLAERATGIVVEKTADGLPSLIVAYTPPGGPEQRIESDGVAAYDAIPVGAEITVYYDARRPDHARLDLFLELWLWPMVLGGLTLLVALPFGLAMRLMRRVDQTLPRD